MRVGGEVEHSSRAIRGGPQCVVAGALTGEGLADGPAVWLPGVPSSKAATTPRTALATMSPPTSQSQIGAFALRAEAEEGV